MSEKRFPRVSGPSSTVLWGQALAGLALLAMLPFASTSSAQVAVQTIGGGVRAQCGPSAGFKAGNTWTAAQFNNPNSAALDSQGNLWVADVNNSDIEEVTTAGNRTTSLTVEYAPSGNKHPFPSLVGVSVDSADNLYVMTATMLYKFTDAPLSFPALNLAFPLSLSSFATGAPTAVTVVNDGASSIYIAFTGGTTGTIVRIPQPYTGAFTTVVSGFSFNPSGIAMRDDGTLVVSDTLHSGIYLVGTNANSTPVLLAGGTGPGFANGASGFAKFNNPRGLAASADGRMVVCDTGNNLLRIIDTANNTTTLYGTASNVWTATCCSCSPTLYGGWVDGNAGTTTSSASGRQPVSVNIAPNGTLFVTESFYSLIRAATGSGLTPVTSVNSGGGGGGGSTNAATVLTLAATGITTTSGTLNASVVPNGSATTVYFEWGTNTSYGTQTATTVISTNLGGSNAVSVTLTGLQVGTVIHYRADAINNGGTALGIDRSFITTSVTSSSNQLGFISSIEAGIGSTAYVPLVLQLQSGSLVDSIQFRVEVTPTPPNSNMISALTLVPITTNDFVPLAGPNPANTPVNFSIVPYTTSSNGQGLLVFGAPGSGLSIQGFGAVGLLQIPIPFNAATNQRYSLNVLYPSGSASNITALNQILTVVDAPYLAGDSYPATGYNSESFGDGALDNNDVVNALFASTGIRVPPFDSDAFNAMDVYPQTPTHNGDGVINFQDWNTILLRSVGLDTNNWYRYWTNGGNLFGSQTGVGLPGSPFIFTGAVAQSGPAPGDIWTRPASISAGNVTNQLPGNTCSIPIYAKVHPGYSLAGFQFRAIVSPVSNAPAVGQVHFAAASGLAAPMTLQGLSSNDILNAWALGAISQPLQNSNYIGSITFQIPPTAQAGQAYAVHFLGVDGAQDSSTECAMESFPAYVTVLSGALPAPSATSDEWKMKFFGSLTAPAAADNADADGDGASNVQEYLAGTDPTSADSALRFTNSLPSGGSAKLAWLTAPDKTYILESSSSPGGKTWSPVNTNTGDGNTYQFIVNKSNGNAVFYRIRLQP